MVEARGKRLKVEGGRCKEGMSCPEIGGQIFKHKIWQKDGKTAESDCAVQY